MIRNAMMIAVAMTAILSTNNVFAGDHYKHGQQRTVLQHVPPQHSTPKLGVSGHARSGWGYIIDYVRHGSTAARMGLERGDVIKFVNDHRINSGYDLKKALRVAANHYNGRLTIVVDNVRARHGQSNRRIVTVRGNLYGWDNSPKQLYSMNSPRR